MTTPDGFADTGYGAIADAFVANFADHGEVGAAVTLYRDGVAVVDLWGGVADERSGDPWVEDTVVMVFSTTKGVTATCAAILVQEGALDVDEPVATYWPEFAANGKQDIPVRWLLSHRAGLAAVDGEMTMEAITGWHGVVEAIAAQAPNWEPGTTHGYHARSYGWTVGEVIRRITGRSPGTYFREAIAEPLGLDFWIGLPAAIEARCADLIPATGGVDLASRLGGDELLARVLWGPSNLFISGYDESWNQRAIRAAEMPSSNGIGDARSLARMYAATIGEVDGVRLLDADTVETMTTPQSSGTDCVLGVDLDFGLGYSVQPTIAPGAGPRAFGHPGAGGSVAFADPDAGIGFGYVMNQMQLGITGDPRSQGLIEAVYRSLG